MIIVNYNAGSFLLDCVQSSLGQADEVLVVDNASGDDSLDRLIARYGNDPKLKVIRNDINRGFAAACNTGMREARGNRILFLNPDCRLEPNTASEMLKALDANSVAGMAGGLLSRPDGSEQPGGRRAVPTPWRSFVRAFGLSRFSHRWPKLFSDFYLHELPLPVSPEDVEAISGACLMVKREAVDQVGSWDEGYFLHCEDLDWCMRFRQKGWKVIFVPSARVIHDAGVCSQDSLIFVEWHKHKGMMRFYKKFFRKQYPSVLFWLVGAGVWIRFNAIAVSYGLKNFSQWLKHGRV
ncbi:MAG: glycosyltransferase family 2 protein [Smithellaceae bacterium]